MSEMPAAETPTQRIEIDFFRSEDAPGIARLFRQVYGESYPISMYYLPDRLIEGNAAGEIISSVARTPTGEIAGHDALVVLDPATRLYENVQPERSYRLFAAKASFSAYFSILSSMPRNVSAWRGYSGNPCATTFICRKCPCSSAS